ncbi:MAG: helix-turn-helix transcriptional regulator [Caulobacteraceae bacterium]|nr:helix-turn-helix transcriptional regulator [Caulobacteraceae bacterium]
MRPCDHSTGASTTKLSPSGASVSTTARSEDIGGLCFRASAITTLTPRQPRAPTVVEYSLTPLGRLLLSPIDVLAQWAEQNLAEVLEA